MIHDIRKHIIHLNVYYSGRVLGVDTRDGMAVVHLPTHPKPGDTYTLVDPYGTWETNVPTISYAPYTNKYCALSLNLSCEVQLVWGGTTWQNRMTKRYGPVTRIVYDATL